MPASSYVIITPAHNEEAFIENAIDSIVSQTLRPGLWIVVNDGSTDRTGEIVCRYAREYEFIKVINRERPKGRHFGNKASAFRCGARETLGRDYEYIGNVDADISLERTYYERIVHEMERDRSIGIAGGIVFTRVGNKYITEDQTLDSVGGAVQLFRRACYEQIGGYLSLRCGGIDAAAEIMARMKGWRVKKFPENRVYEHRRTGSALTNPLMARVREGQRFQSLGYSFLFYMLRCVYRLGARPVVVGSCASLVGYMLNVVCGRPISLPKEVVGYLRCEQREKIRCALGMPRGRKKSG
jgi:biofilm PGA synthesis N-glycosyltransferase PgaC